jgi:hypothetical protein
MKLIIETARNGFIIREPATEEGYTDEVDVVANDDPAQASFEMLWNVLERIGHVGSRYDEARVRVTIEPGDKWMSPEEALEIYRP